MQLVSNDLFMFHSFTLKFNLIMFAWKQSALSKKRKGLENREKRS